VLGLGSASAGPGSTFFCNTTVSGTAAFNNVDVPSGAICAFDGTTSNHTHISGNLTVEGRLVQATNVQLDGNLVAEKAQVVAMDNSTVNGDTTLHKLKNAPSNLDPVDLEDNTFNGSLTVTKSRGGTGDFTISTNTVNGDENDNQNKIAGDLSISAETVNGNLTIKGNTGSGTKEFDGNSVNGTLTCQKNKAPVESHANTATVFSGGQCS
jgi:hypothetical protein